MASFRYINEAGEERRIEGLEGFLNAVRDGHVGPDTLVGTEESRRWRPAKEVVPTAFASAPGPSVETSEAPPEKGSSAYGWIVVGFLAVAGYWKAGAIGVGEIDISYRIGEAIGTVLTCLLVGWLFTRFPRSARPHWPTGALIFWGLAFLGSLLPDTAPPETSEALDDLDVMLSDMRSEVDGTRQAFDSLTGQGEVSNPAELGTDQGNAGLVRAITRMFESLSQATEGLARSFGVDGEPHPSWLELEYFIRPSAFSVAIRCSDCPIIEMMI